MHSICKVLPVLFLIAVMTGCITSGKCRVAVANASDSGIRSVVLADTNGNTYAFANLAPHSEPCYRPVRGAIGSGVELRIVDASGTNVSRIVDLDPPVRPDYRGCLLFQIENDTRIRTFFLPDDDTSPDNMPWAVAPPWQGAIPVPGMPVQQ